MLIDISPPLSSRIAVWPQDVPFTRKVSMDTNCGDSLTLSSIHSTLHVGAHADAPNHYVAGADGIGARNLELYYGSCQVISVSVPPGERLGIADVREPIIAPRILFRTDSFPDPERWNTDFCALSADLIHLLHTQGVRLVGIDTPSVDLHDDKQLQSHQAIAQHDMAILEGLVLSHVQAGPYTLCALPLRLEDADASPVRAVLIAV